MNNLKDIFPTKQNLLDPVKRYRFQLVLVSFIFFIVGVLFTVFNIINDEKNLGIVTGIFSMLSFITFICSALFERGLVAIELVFVTVVILMFSYFIITGGASSSSDGVKSTEGFSTYWLLILPFCGMLVLGLKKGTITASIMFVIVAICLWIPYLRDNLLTWAPSDTFVLRFPFVYLSAFAVSFMFEFSRNLTNEANNNLRNKLEFAADVDYLTKLKNRHWLAEYVKKETKNFKPGTKFVCNCFLIDADGFKNANDRYGHAFGDEVLVALSRVFVKYGGEYAVRFGGDEFIILSKNVSNSILYETGEKIRREVEMIHFHNHPGFSITVSIGIASKLIEKASDLDDIINAADEQSARAKQHGKNCVYMVDYDSLLNK